MIVTNNKLVLQTFKNFISTKEMSLIKNKIKNDVSYSQADKDETDFKPPPYQKMNSNN